MRMIPVKTDPTLLRLLEDSVKAVKEMSEAEREEMCRRQRDGWVKAEMSWPKDCPYR